MTIQLSGQNRYPRLPSTRRMSRRLTKPTSVSNAVPVDVEVVPSLLIHEGVEVDRHQVVLHGPVTFDPVGPHDGRILVVRVEGEVEGLRIVRDVDVRGFRGGCPVEWGLLRELAEVRGHRPNLVVQHAVDHRWFVGSRRADTRSSRNEPQLLRGRAWLSDDRRFCADRLGQVALGPSHRRLARRLCYEKGRCPQDEDYRKERAEPRSGAYSIQKNLTRGRRITELVPSDVVIEGRASTAISKVQALLARQGARGFAGCDRAHIEGHGAGQSC